MFEEVFKTKKLIPEKLSEYGFIKQDDRMIYTTHIIPFSTVKNEKNP